MRSCRCWDVLSPSSIYLSWVSRFKSSTFKDKTHKGRRHLRVWCLRDTQSWGNCSCKDKRGTQRSHKSLFKKCSTHTHSQQQGQPLPSRQPHAPITSWGEGFLKGRVGCLSRLSDHPQRIEQGTDTAMVSGLKPHIYCFRCLSRGPNLLWL